MIEFNTREEYEKTGLRLTDEQFAKEIAFAKSEVEKDAKKGVSE